MNAHLLKPLSPEELERMLLQVFDPAASAEALDGEPEPDGNDSDDEEAQAQAAFQTSMGAEASLRFIGQFQKQLEQRFGEETREALQSDAHKVAGSAGLMGLPRLGAAARRLEDACEAGGDFSEALAELRRGLTQGQASLAAWSARLSKEANAAA